MARFIATEQGEQAYLNDITTADYQIHLFTDDISGFTAGQFRSLTPTFFTAAAFPGYSTGTLSSGNWVSTEKDGAAALRYNTAVTFTCTADTALNTIYGYYLTTNNGSTLRGVGLLDTYVPIEFDGDEIIVTPTLSIGSREDTMPVGSITQFGSLHTPDGWLLCDGSAVSRTTYIDLYNVIFDAYGAGNGSTTFNLPDFRQRFPLGKSSSGTGSSLGQTGGSIDHVHDLDDASAFAKIQTATAGYIIYEQQTVEFWDRNVRFDPTGGIKTADSGSGTGAVGLGGDTAANNPPYTTVNYIIKY